MELASYSERGVINALFYSIWIANKADKTINGRFLEAFIDAVYWEPNCAINRRGSQLNKIFIEPSLSDFGDPDALMMADGPDGKCLIFVEAKRVNCQLNSAWMCFCEGLKRKPPENRAQGGVFSQLYYKVRLAEAMKERGIPEEGLPFFDPFRRKPRACKNGGAITYANRTIGKNLVVKAIADEIENFARESYFVVIVSDEIDKVKAAWNEVIRWADEIMPHHWSTHNWGILSWRDIEEIGKLLNLRHFLDVFCFNRPQILGECAAT